MNPRLWLSVGAGIVLTGLSPLFPAPLFGQAPARSQPSVAVSQKMPDSIEPGAPLPIEIIVGNGGSSAAEGVIVTDQLPAGYDVLDAAPAAEQGQGTLTWRLGHLGAGESRVLRLRLGPRAPAGAPPPQNAVEVAYQGRAQSVCVGQVRAAELDLRVTPPPAGFTGERVVCRMEVVNRGRAPARDVSVQTLLPDGLSHPMGSDLESSLGTLGPGESRVVSLEATPTRPGELRVRVTAQAQGLRPVVQETVVRAENNPLRAAVAGPKLLQNQLTGLYEVSVRNDGPVPVRELALTVSVPQGMDFAGAGSGGRYDAATRLVRWELGELRAGEERTVAWNGTAHSCGDLEGRVRLTMGAQVAREQSWITHVVAGEGTPARTTPAKGFEN